MSDDPVSVPEASPENNESKPDPAKKDAVEAALEVLKPAIMKLSFGSVMGYCSGMALKKVGKAVAFVVGLGFVGLQAAATAGYLELNWKKIGNDAIVKPLDTSGDGKLGFDDVKEWWKKLRYMLTYKLPDAAGFSVGFLYGVRYG
eukprot:Nitzschia sp. Nitz4//scaffold18_size181773//47015//47659//NITZ4_001904-RA/size181773-snap-gene-0.258-mRNA-1//1//CDS//3329539978//3404//frame0